MNTPVRVPASESGGMLRRASSASQVEFEREPLTRVDVRRLARRDAEERGVELVQLIDHAGPAARHLARGRRDPDRRSASRSQRLVGHFRHGVAALAQLDPRTRRGRRAARIAAAHADDGDRFVLGGDGRGRGHGVRNGGVRRGQMARERAQRREVPDDRRRHGAAEPLFETRRQFDRVDRRRAVLDERMIEIDRFAAQVECRVEAAGDPALDHLRFGCHRGQRGVRLRRHRCDRRVPSAADCAGCVATWRSRSTRFNTLSGAIARQLVDEVDGGGRLERGEPSAAPRDDVRLARRRGGRCSLRARPRRRRVVGADSRAASTIAAQTRSPSTGAGTPKTAASATAGCCDQHASTFGGIDVGRRRRSPCP